MSQNPQHTNAEIKRNARDVRQAVLVNAIGYTVKPLIPVLMVLVIRCYGANGFGIYALCEAMLLLLMRCCLLGMDQTLIWWVPRQTTTTERSQIRPILAITGMASLGAMLALFVLPSAMLLELLSWVGPADDGGKNALAFISSLKLMALGLFPVVLSQVLAAAVVGRRRMQAKVLIKGTLVPLTFVALALILFACGYESSGLALAYVIASWFGLLGMGVAFIQSFRKSSWPRNEGLLIRQELRRYAWPMWLGQTVNAYRDRMDLLAVSAAFFDPAITGVYAVIVSIANVVKEFRQAIAPLLLAIWSKASASGDRMEMAASFSYGTTLIMIVQIPIVVFLVLFGDWILDLYGPGYSAYWAPLVVLCVVGLENGLFESAGLVIASAGRSWLTLCNSIGTVLLRGMALYFALPTYGLLGATFAVLTTQMLRHAVQLGQMRLISGDWHYRPVVLRPLLLGAIASLMCALSWWILATSPWPTAPLVAGLTFSAVYCIGLTQFWRTGLLSGKSDSYHSPLPDRQPQNMKPHQASAA